MQRRRAWMGLAAAAVAAGRSQAAPPLRAVGGQFARIFEGTEGVQPRGLAVDLLTELYGDSLICEWLPWPRAQMMVENGEADLLIGPYRTPEREARFVFSVRPFYEDAMVWFARRGEGELWSGDFEALAPRALAAVRGWAYGSRFERYRPQLRRLTQVLSVEAGLQMLALKRVDLFAANERNCAPVLERLHLGDAFEPLLPPLDVLRGHMAFPRTAAGEQLARRHDQLVERLLRSPLHAELYRRWGLKPPSV